MVRPHAATRNRSFCETEPVLTGPRRCAAEGKHLDEALAVHFGGAGEAATAVVVLDSNLVVLPSSGRSRSFRLPLGAHSVGTTATVANADAPDDGRPGVLIALDLPTGTAAVVFYADPLYDEAPVTVELPAANRATCLCMTTVAAAADGTRVFLGMS